MNKLVSIIIPVYNAEKYLRTCLNSAVGQTWKNKEIIVIDDGSSDNSLAIAREFSNIIVLSQSNKGAAAARNSGLRIAKGDYIQFLDSDDFLHQDKIKNQIDGLNTGDQALLLGPTIFFEDNSDFSSYPVKHEWFREGSRDNLDFLIKLYGGNTIGPGYGGMIQPNAWLVPRSLIDKAGLWNESLNLDDDGEFFCRIILSATTIAYCPSAINYYRQYKTEYNLSAKKDTKHLRSLFDSWLLKKSYLEKFDHPQIKLVIRRNFTEMAYYFFNYNKELSNQALKIALEYGGTTHSPFFGNKILNVSKHLFGWRTMFLAQKYLNKLKRINLR